MLNKYFYLLLIVGFFADKGEPADSDGNAFVFSFPYDHGTLQLSSAAIASVIVIPIYGDTACTFQYTETSDYKVVTVQEMAILGATNEFTFNINDVVTSLDYYQESFVDRAIKDFRIFANCTDQVKLIGKILDPINSWGDHFLIPSITNADTHYFLSTPDTNLAIKGVVGILPISIENTISIDVLAYANDVLVLNQTLVYDTTIGKDQHYISIYFDSLNDQVTTDINTSISITATSSIMLFFEAPSTTTSNLDSSCGASCYGDYVTFMPIASQPIPCNTFLTPPHQRMITNDFTTRLHVAPPNLPATCNDVAKITVYNDVNNVQGTEQIVDMSGLTEISLINNTVIGFSSYVGQMVTNRHGSIIDEDGITAHGHFMHYVPSVQEWVTGKTQFYTLAKDCILEFYADINGSDPGSIQLDGHPLSSLKFDKNPLPIFGNKYSQFIVKIKGHGLHTLVNNGNYVAYVICKNVGGPNDAAGYLTGFNKRK